MFQSSKENLLRSDSADSLQQNATIQQVIPIAAARRKSSEYGSYTTSTYGVWQPKPQRNNILIQTAEVHREDVASKLPAREDATVNSSGPIPLPRRRNVVPQATERKFMAEPAIDSALNNTSFESTDVSQLQFESQKNGEGDVLSDIVTPFEHSPSLTNTVIDMTDVAPDALLNPLNETTVAEKSTATQRKSLQSEEVIAVSSDSSERGNNHRQIQYETPENNIGIPAAMSNRSAESTSESASNPSSEIASPIRKPKRVIYQHREASGQPSTASSEASQHSRDEYRYENLINIHLHDTTPMMIDYSVGALMVRCSVMDVVTGKMLLKSDPTRSAVMSNEPDAVNFLQPIISKLCTFKQSEYIECLWNESMLINEDIAHIQTGNEIILFELLSVISRDHSDFLNIAMTDGWQYICWAFLRPGDSHSFSHLDERCRLQLYEYQRPRFRLRRKSVPAAPVFEQWRMVTRKKYPATMDVTVRAFHPIPAVSSDPEPMRRPQNAFQTDRRVDPPPQMAEILTNIHQRPTTHVHHPQGPRPAEDLLEHWRRLPGQPCRMPNQLLSKVQPIGSRGSLVARFSPSGEHLAIALVPELPHQSHEIAVLRIPNGETVLTLSGHNSLVYGLEWKIGSPDTDTDDAAKTLLLLSVSADRMAIVWRIHLNSSTHESVVLPHPCFLYSGVFVDASQGNQTLVATGGRDGILRIWSCLQHDRKENVPKYGAAELLQELNATKSQADYVTGLVCSRMSARVYSADSTGAIVEWTRHKERAFQRSRIVVQLDCDIRQLEISANGAMLYALGSNAMVVICNVNTGQRVRAIHLVGNGTAELPVDPGQPPACFTLSPCGSLLLCCADERLQAWSLMDSNNTAPFRLPFHGLPHRLNGFYATSIDYNAHSFLCSVSVFGGRKSTGSAGVCCDAGVWMLGWDGKRALAKAALSTTTVKPNVVHSTMAVHKLNSKQHAGTDGHRQQDLNRIIRRIDEIFARPQNRTDDVKTKGDEDMEMRSLAGGTPRDSLASEGACNFQRSNTSNKTFTVQRDATKGANRTYSVSPKRSNDSADETTVSESM